MSPFGAFWRELAYFSALFGARPRSRRLIATKRHKKSQKYLQAADAEKVPVGCRRSQECIRGPVKLPAHSTGQSPVE